MLTHGAVWLGNTRYNGKQYASYDCIVGSSNYNTEQMAFFINGIIAECEEQNIATDVDGWDN